MFLGFRGLGTGDSSVYFCPSPTAWTLDFLWNGDANQKWPSDKESAIHWGSTATVEILISQRLDQVHEPLTFKPSAGRFSESETSGQR